MSDIVIALFWGCVCSVLLLAFMGWLEPEGCRRMGGPPGYVALGEWLEEHMPDLYKRLNAMPLDDQRAEMNRLTGLDVKPNDCVEEGSRRFLQALQKMKEEGKC